LQRFDLEDGAGLVALDWVTSGRRARGERWAFRRYDSRLEVRCSGRLVLFDRVLLDPAEGRIGARLGRCNVLCVVAIVGSRFAIEARRILAGIAERAVERRGDVWIGASPVQSGGALIRVAGASVEAVTATVRRLLAFVPALLGDDPWVRKW